MCAVNSAKNLKNESNDYNLCCKLTNQKKSITPNCV